jgi:hypothetical protein
MRYPWDRDVREVAEATRKLARLLRALHDLRRDVSVIVCDLSHSEDDKVREVENLLASRAPLLPNEEVDRRLLALLGRETFSRLLEESRGALRSSEAVFILSEAVLELKEDLSTVLLGFCKASEVEGRRVLCELIERGHPIRYWNRRTNAEEELADSASVRRDVTGGSLGVILSNARFATDSPWQKLPFSQLGDRFRHISTVRNRSVHRDNLTEAVELNEVRSMIGNPPEGILPSAIQCVCTIEEHDGTEIQKRVDHLTRDLQKSNASYVVPRQLDTLRGALRQAFAERAIKILGERWLREPRRANQAWTSRLLAAGASSS